MRILLISPLYYPACSPNVYRWDAIARYWTGQGHEIHWLCTRFGNEPEEAKINGIFIHRTGYHTLLDWVYDLLNIQEGRRGTLGAGMPRRSRFRRFAEGIVNLTWRKVYWSDGACLWYFPAKRKALELMRLHAFEAVISVSLPFTTVRIACALKKTYPDLHWLMDIEDPFSFVVEYFINNRALYKSLNIKVEERALQLADVVSVTVEAARNKYITHFPFVEEKIYVVPPLYEEMQLVGTLPEGFQKEESNIHLGYFGTFYYPIRNPEGLLRLISAVVKENPELANRLTIHFAGTVPVEYTDVFRSFTELKGMLRFYGLISRREVAGMMQEMDFLINIGNSTDYHLPSKSAEYLISDKPVVNVACIREDSFVVFMKDYPLLLNLVLEHHRVNRAQVSDFTIFINEKINNTGGEVQRRRLGESYYLKSVADMYMQLLIVGRLSA